MRLFIALGSLTILTICAVLYLFFQNILFGMVGQLTYDPPADAARLAAAFERLARLPSDTPGVSIGAIADARLACLAGDREPGAADEAFRRANLVMLGAGVQSFSPVISPEARRVAELRPDLSHADNHTRVKLAAAPRRSVRKVIESLEEPGAAIYLGLDLSSDAARRELRRLVETLADGGAALRDC
ncbi:MAG: hypothetical protein ACK5MQ_10030 [Pikeienuella sp.]